MEERVSQQSSHRESDHDVQRSGVNVSGAESEEEVGRARDVEGGEHTVVRRGGEGEEHGEGALEERWRGGVLGGRVGREGDEGGALLDRRQYRHV